MLSAFSLEADVTKIPPKYCCGVLRIAEYPELEGTIESSSCQLHFPAQDQSMQQGEFLCIK